MPLYRCTSPSGSLNDAQRAAIAVAFTDIHCDLTGAPRTFVHVQFHHQPTQAERAKFSLHAGIRAGRDLALTESLTQRCIAAVARIAAVPPEQISMRISATRASWILEGGRVLPEPGEEDAWVSAHA